jgi:hypothetical protein
MVVEIGRLEICVEARPGRRGEGSNMCCGKGYHGVHTDYPVVICNRHGPSLVDT